MGVFALREQVVGEYREYDESFINILDDDIQKSVSADFDKGALKPSAMLQLNPAYEMAATLGELLVAR